MPEWIKDVLRGVGLLALLAAAFGVALGITMYAVNPGVIYPIVIGGPENRICVPLEYRIVQLDPEFGLTTEEAYRLIEEAAEPWNDEAGCELLARSDDGPLKIKFVHSPTNNALGICWMNMSKIEVYDSWGTPCLKKTMAHELGHAIGIDDHNKVGGIMRQGCRGLRLNDEDRLALRNEFWFL